MIRPDPPSATLGPRNPPPVVGPDPSPVGPEGEPETEGDLVAFDPDLFVPPIEAIARAGRRNLLEKLIAGLHGFKHAIRGDSSFFAHAYRALLVFLIAGMIGVPPVGWCLLVLGLGLVMIAELAHSALDTLARASGDPDEPRMKMVRDIAAAGVLVAVVVSASISITVLTLKLGDYLGWWERSPWEFR